MNLVDHTRPHTPPGLRRGSGVLFLSPRLTACLGHHGSGRLVEASVSGVLRGIRRRSTRPLLGIAASVGAGVSAHGSAHASGVGHHTRAFGSRKVPRRGCRRAGAGTEGMSSMQDDHYPDGTPCQRPWVLASTYADAAHDIGGRFKRPPRIDVALARPCGWEPIGHTTTTGDESW